MNDARKGLQLPKGQRIPYLEKPKRDGKKYGAMPLCLSAADTMRYAVYSVALVEPLLTAEATRRPKWISWVAHVRLLTFVLGYTFDEGASDILARLVLDYLTKFRAAYGPCAG